MTVPWPTHGEDPWDDDLKAYLDYRETQTVLARFVDEANATQSLVAGAFTIISPTVAVPPTVFPVTAEWGAPVTIGGGGGNGYVGVALCDITDPSIAAQVVGEAGRGAAFIAGTFSASQNFYGIKPLKPSTTWRYYRLYGIFFRDSGSWTATIAASGAAAAATGASLAANFNSPFVQVTA